MLQDVIFSKNKEAQGTDNGHQEIKMEESAEVNEHANEIDVVVRYEVTCTTIA